MNRIVAGLLVAVCFMGALSARGEAPKIHTVGVEESVPTGIGRLMHIATDSLNQPHIVSDVGGQSINYFYDKIGSTWLVSSYNSGGSSSQSYNPRIEINNSDQAWISVVKWWQDGMGMMVRNTMATTPSAVVKYSATTGGAGGLPVSNLSLDPTTENRSVVYGGNGGHYEKVLWNAGANSFQSEGTGSLDTGPGGEKNFFHVSRAGNFQHGGNGFGNQAVWHSCSDYSYNNSVRKSYGKSAVGWASFGSYPWMGDDGCYPCVVGDNVEHQTAYLLSDYTQFGGPGLALNVWRASNAQGDGDFAFSEYGGLLIIDANGTSSARRFEPQLCAAKEGGAWACYTVGSELHIRYIPSDITGAGDLGPVTKWAGGRGSICADNQGNLHVTYLNGGSVKYRKLEVSGVNLTSPVGRTTDRTPKFQWTVPEGTTAVKQYYWPKGDPGSTVSNDIPLGVTSFTPTNDLAPGHWMWSVEGTLNAEQITGDTEFHIPPPAPVLTAPLTWLDETNNMPTFVWGASEGATWYHIRVERNFNDPPYGSQIVLNEWTQDMSWTTTVALAKGDYSWDVQGFIGTATPNIWGDFSEAGSFQIAVPGQSTIVQPTGMMTYTNETPTFEWTMAASDTNDLINTWYQLFIVRDGRVVNDTTGGGTGWFTEEPGHGTTSLNVESNGNLTTSAQEDALVPGEYGLWLRSTDGAHGSGPWAGMQFTVNREMTPGTPGAEIGFGPTLPVGSLRPFFTWTAQPDAPWYNIILTKDGAPYINEWSRTATWQPGTDLPYGQYRWWVAPYYTANSSYGPWLNAAAFQAAVPGNATPLTPSGNTNATPTFTWSAAEAADGYDLYYQIIGNPATGVTVPMGAGMTHTPAALTAGGYRWWVAASNQYGQVWHTDPATDFIVE